MKCKGSKGWVVVRQKALRVVLIHVVASGKLLVGGGWHHLHHAVLLHAACRGSQLLPDVEREVVGGEEGDGSLYRQMGLCQRDHLLNPILLVSVGLSQAVLVLLLMLHWFWLDDARQLVDIGSIGSIVHSCKAALMLLTRLLLLLLLLRCLSKMSLRFLTNRFLFIEISPFIVT